MFRFLILTLLFAATPATALAGGGGSADAGVCPGFAEGPTVILRDGCFTGVAHFVTGDSLTLRNGGQAPHTYTAVDGSFDTGIMTSGATAELRGIAPGVYQVYCTLHATRAGDGMTGVLVVGTESTVAAAPDRTMPATAEDGGRAGAGIAGAGIGAAAGWLLAAGRRNRAQREPVTSALEP